MNDQEPTTRIEALEQALAEERSRRAELEQALVETQERAADLAVQLETYKHDIWSLDEVQQALEAVSRSGSEFVIQMDHRIRTTLTGLIGMIELLLNSDLTDQEREFATGASDSGHELLRILNDVLDYCRLDAGHVEFTPGALHAESFLEDVAIVGREALGEKPVEVIVDLDERLPEYLVADEGNLRRVLGHLVSNAATFTENGSLILSLGLVGKGEDALVQLEVTDTGAGIPAENLTRVCQAFESSDGAGGLGLGLALVRRLVECMGGTFQLESEVGKGTTARIGFPMDQAISPEAQVAAGAEVADNEGVARVLVAEDNEVNQRVAVGFLKMIGCEVEVADNGLEAISRLEQADFDLVLMDCMMPELDGYETTKSIRGGQAGEAYSSIPIIALTADDSPGARQNCLRAGMDDYMTKPVQIDLLRSALRTWLPPSLRPPAA